MNLRHPGTPRPGALSGRRSGFTIFECLVAIFILLVGLLGVISVFSVGMQSRLKAQELALSQDLSNQWYEWVRFRMNDTQPSGGARGILHRSDIVPNLGGDFFAGTGDLCFTPADDPRNMATVGVDAYRGYKWMLTSVNAGFKPEWLAENGSGTRPWTTRLDGGSLLPAGLQAPGDLLQVQMEIVRGVRTYPFTFVFSGVGVRYDKP
jgi:type II secretory pathway pseudopilin PulG